ncbi:anti-sigma factor domain-containing protein [Thermoanaerobacterium sp. RBIITD]|uniref:anti-sigma factor domain-containing protein n=1 Tax=Thermoanaerobacterium sp. RBIITD TaxID=1550240 RepID=UPI000BB95610|nr:anti-sigma factor domain-containing protein [Thermoanaerobacterium sp. RBIITD]SNX53879.1 Anti-sigma factor N-terminus [Thermoanaerobacterium sp. RBIITD]
MKAVIIDKENGSAYVMTQNGQFKKIKDKSEYMIGNSIEIESKSIRNYFIKFAVAALIIISLYISIINFIPHDVYAYVYLDINPSIVASIDRNAKVITVSSFNTDGDKLIKGIKFKGIDIGIFIKTAIDRAYSLGFIKRDNETIAITTVPSNNNAFNKINEKIHLVEQDFKKDNQNINFIVQTTDENHRKYAEKLKISAGRLVIWEKAEKDGISIPKNMINSENFFSEIEEKYAKLNKNIKAADDSKNINNVDKNANKHIERAQNNSYNFDNNNSKNIYNEKKESNTVNEKPSIKNESQNTEYKEKEPVMHSTDVKESEEKSNNEKVKNGIDDKKNINANKSGPKKSK